MSRASCSLRLRFRRFPPPLRMLLPRWLPPERNYCRNLMKSRINVLLFCLLMLGAMFSRSLPAEESSDQEPEKCEDEGGGGGDGPLYQSVNEGTGAKYRKVGLNGFPIPDEKPQQQEETDQSPEETYVDPFTQTLTHQVTDVYVPMPGADMALSVRRNWSTEIFSNKGLDIRYRPDRPFGPGWQSNICSYINFSGEDGIQVATVVDNDGASYRFLAFMYAEGGLKYFPLNSDRNCQETFKTTLEAVFQEGVRAKFIFRKKFKTTLTFELTNVARNTESGAEAWARLTKVEDRFGTVEARTYVDPDPEEHKEEQLIPSTITIREKTISITKNADNRVTQITDPRGNSISYAYSTMPDPRYPQFSGWPILASVTRGGGTPTQYACEFVIEPDATPDAGFGSYFAHFDLTSIQDQLGNTWAFQYALDRSRFSLRNGNWYRTSGNARNIVSVTQPDGKLASFINGSRTWIERKLDGSMSAAGERKTDVKDVEGKDWSYNFTDGLVEAYSMLGPLMSNTPIAASKVKFQIAYRTLTVTTPEGGEMVAKFEPTAGNALKSFQDLGVTAATTFAYDDDFDYLSSMPWMPSALIPYLPVFKAGDVTSQTNGLGKTKTFTYDPTWRVMNKTIDEEGRVTEDTIDPVTGNRTSQIVKASDSETAPIVQQTDYEYSPDFKGVVSKKTIAKRLGADPFWSKDLVTSYQLEPITGNILKEKVGSAGHERVSEYTYDANNNKLTSEDPNGNVTSFVYDGQNRLTETHLPGSSVKRLYYDARGNKVREDDELGRSTLRVYDSLNRVVKQARDMDGDHELSAADLVTETTYNGLGAKTSVKSPNGWVTTMAYDGLNRLVKTTDPYGKETTFEYGENSGGLQFGRDFMPVKVTDPLGYETLTTYDATYRPIEKKAEYQDGVYAVTKYEYDDVGNLVKEYDPLTTTLVPRITQKTYDALNRETSTIWPDLTATHTYYTSTGLKWKVEDELGNDTLTEYDDAGRPVKVSSPEVDNGLGVTARAVTQTQYDDAGNVIKTINPLGYEWTYTFDNRNRKLTETRPGTGTPTLHWSYDAVGNVVKTTDARGNETDTTYDAANRVTKVEQPSVAIYGGGSQRPTTLTEYDRNGNATKVTDPNGHETLNTYDKLNRLVTTTDAESIVVRNEYDFAGNRTAIVDGKNQRTEFTYDGLKRNLTVKDAGNKTTTFQYNAVDKTARVDAMGHRTEYGYDLRHRLTTVNYVGRSQDNRVMSYDATGNLLTVTEPDASKAGKADVGYTYDALKRQLTETSGGLTHQYKYDLAGNRTSVLYGGLSVPLISAYDAQNRLSTLTQGPLVTTYAYDLDGNILTKTLPNGDATTSTFDAANRTMTLVSTRGSGGLPLSSYTYAYDPAANVKQVTEAYSNASMDRVVTNTYDAINRLTQEAVTGSGAGTTLYSYDNAHNRETMTKGGVLTSYSYNSRNQLTSFTEGSSRTVSYTYDNNGNRLTRTEGINTDTFTWDNENRLIALAKTSLGGSGTYGWGYDYRTRRVELAYNATVTKAVFSGGTEVREFENGLPSVDYVRGSDWGGGVGGILYTERAGVPSFTHYNRRGDVTAKTDATGNITYQATYEAFGKRVTETGATLDRQKSNTKDEDVPGYANEGFRFRDLETGAFLSKDPAGFVDGPNLYAYVVQNPWTNFDPEGLKKIKDYEDEIAKERKQLERKLKQISNSKGLNERSKQRLLDQAYKTHGARIENAQGAIDRIEASAQGINQFAKLLNDAAELSGKPGRFSYVDSRELDDSKYEDMGGLLLKDSLRATSAGLTGLAIVAGVGELTVLRGAAAMGPGEVLVTRWGREGLKAGDWVMQGGKTWWNYIMSGKWQPNWMTGNNKTAPFRSGETSSVPQSAVRAPQKGDVGTENENAATLLLKERLNQRVYDPKQ
ncbi:type IV secretion protein Rhs [Spartobacteria bacterium LR76]|nr:type IV secretion protein Rhs [Spartobacteria bacterium LR76]